MTARCAVHKPNERLFPRHGLIINWANWILGYIEVDLKVLELLSRSSCGKHRAICLLPHSDTLQADSSLRDFLHLNRATSHTLLTHVFWQTVCRSEQSWSQFMTSLSPAWGTRSWTPYLEGFIIQGVLESRNEVGCGQQGFGSASCDHHISCVVNCRFHCLCAAFQ